MITFLGLVVPCEDMTPAAFYDHWINRHGPLVTATKAVARHMRRYVQYHAIRPAGRYFGIGEVWFDTPQGADRAFAEADYHSIIRPDEQRFSWLEKCQFVTMEDDVPPETCVSDGSLVLFRFLRPRNGIDRTVFEARLEEGASRQRSVLAAQGLEGYRCWPALLGSEDPMRTGTANTLNYHAVEMLWTSSGAAGGAIEMIEAAGRALRDAQTDLIDEPLDMIATAHVMLG